MQNGNKSSSKGSEEAGSGSNLSKLECFALLNGDQVPMLQKIYVFRISFRYFRFGNFQKNTVKFNHCSIILIAQSLDVGSTVGFIRKFI